MAKTVKWNRVIYDEFNRLAMLTEVEQKILETRIKGWTVKMQATELNMAESTVHAYIRQIKKKYDKYIETSYSGVGYSVTIYGLHDNLNENIFNCYSTLATTIPSYSDTITDFLSTKLFVAQFPTG